MARNEEKLFGRLNRLYLQKQREGEVAKNPPRPKLATLTSADAVRRWLPSIREDIEQHLMQLEVTCHPERVLDGIRRRISCLEFEHRAFMMKLAELDAQATASDKTCYRKRPYKADDEVIASNVDHKSAMVDNSDCSSVASSASRNPDMRIPLPILEGELEHQYVADSRLPTVVWNCDAEACDMPLSPKLSDCCRSTSRPSILNRRRRNPCPTERRDVNIFVTESCSNPTETTEAVVSGGYGALVAAYGDLDD